MRPVARFFSTSCLLILFVTLIAPSLHSQDSDIDDESVDVREPEGKTEPEASAYLLDISLGDGNTDLYWEGYWRFSFVAGGSFGRVSQDTIFPGVNQGATFFQEPDLTLTLWLRDRWFIEASFVEGFDRNTYRAGYVGADDELVREVTVGNAGVNATSYAEIDVPAPRYNTPGIVAKFGTPRSDHEILIRFDPTETDDKTFQGQYEVNTQDIGLPDFVEGRYFILPDQGVSNVVLYLEDRLGSVTGTDGLGTLRRYRQAEPVEFFVDGASGLLVLDEEHDGQVAVYYDVLGTPVGHVSLGGQFIVPSDANFHPDFDAWGGVPSNLMDFDWGEADEYDPGGRTYNVTSRVDIGGADHLVLYEPGRFTPFERQNVYESSRPLPEDTWRIVPLLRDRGALYPVSTPLYGFIPDVEDKTIAVYGTVGAADGLRDPANRYPFAAADPEVYGPGRETDPDKLSRIIVLAIRETNPGFSLGSGVVPGSVVVRVNGVRDKTVEVSDDGRITFSRFVYPDDWIEVSFRTETLDLEGGDLFIYQGNRFELTPRLTWELAESLRWNVSADRTVEEYNQSPGDITVATTLDWQADRAAVRLTGEAVLSTPDTAGNLRLFGMDGGGLGLIFLESTLVESPDDFGPMYTPAGTRVPADKYNYISDDALGREILNDYLWPGASSTGEDGPALAGPLGADPVDTRVMDLRFNLPIGTPGTGDWTAGDFLAEFGGPIDLSNYAAIEFPIRFLDDYDPDSVGGLGGVPPGPPKITLLAGEIGESEDHHEDGSVDSHDEGAMVEWDLSSGEWLSGSLDTAWTSGDWHTVRFTLTPAMRARLGSVRAFRLIVENDTGSALAGRAVMGPPEFDGSPFRTEIREPGNSLAPAQDVAGDELTDNSLKSAFGETAELFHPDGEDNRALRIRWGTGVPGGSDIPAGNRWEAVSWFDEVPPDAYRTLVFYVRDELGVGDMSAEITDPAGRGVHVSWNSAAAGWDRITVNIPDGSAESALGNTVTSVSVDAGADGLTRFLLKGTDSSGSALLSDDSGTILLDEIHFRDPSFTLAGGTELQASWRFEEDVLSIGRFPMLGDISLEGRGVLAGGQVLSGIDRGNLAATGSITAGAVVAGVKVDTDWRGSWGPGTADWSGSHNLRIPARSSVFWVTDLYARGQTGEEVSLSRLNDMNLAVGPATLRLFTGALYDGVSLIQSWGGETGWAAKSGRADLDVRYILNTTGSGVEDGGYFSSWIRDYALILPSEDEATNREAHHELAASVALGPASIEWDPVLRMKSARSPVWNQENRWAGSLSVPLRFPSWSITPTYRRDLTQVLDTSGGANAGYGDVWNHLADGMDGQLPLFTYMPFRELFGEADGRRFASETDGMAEATYQTEFSVGLSRVGSADALDLFVPVTGNFSMERSYERKGDTTGWENEWRGSLGFSAVNLFGRFGRYSFIPLYNSEELSTLYQITLKDYNGIPVPDPEEFLWQTNWAFTGIRNRRMILDHRLTWNWDPEYRDTRQEGRLEFQWRTESQEVLRLPLVNRVIPRRHHLENSERLTVTGIYPWSTAPPDNDFEITFTLRHESRWVFQDNGHLKGWLSFGLGGIDDDVVNGWELGLEAEIRL